MSKLLEVRNLYKQFNMEAGFFSKNRQNVYAVNDLSFSLERGSTYSQRKNAQSRIDETFQKCRAF